MTGIIERTARAMAEHEQGKRLRDEDWRDRWRSQWYREKAIAVIHTLRDNPPDGIDAVDVAGLGNSDIWRALFDAAVNCGRKH
jgi:hypothetical protein